jgi:hypothetical protein
MMPVNNETLEWEISVPLFRNRLILGQLGIAIGIPFGIVLLILLFTRAYAGILLLGILLVLAAILIMLIFHGKYDVHYVINARGILCENQPKQARKVRRVSGLTFLMGLFSGNLTTAGAGLLAGSRTRIMLPWKKIKKVSYNDKHMYITVRGGFGESIALFGTGENYAAIKELLHKKLNL